MTSRKTSDRGSFDSKEKDPEVFTGVQEVVQEAPPTNRLKRYVDRFNVWLASRGLEGHGCVHHCCINHVV